MSNNTKHLPKIKAKDLKESAKSDDPWDYLFNFTDKYFDMLAETPEIIEDFNDSQLVLVAYNYMYGEVVNGGFIQMIINGKAYAFEEPFSEVIRSWGAVRIADIVDRAKAIYEKNKDALLGGRQAQIDFSDAYAKVTSENEAKELEQQVWEKHSKLYEEFTDFDALADEFYACMDEETAVIKRYVENNLGEFGIIVKWNLF